MRKTNKINKKIRKPKSNRLSRRINKKYRDRRLTGGGGLFGSSKYPTVDEIVKHFLDSYKMADYSYYGSIKRTFTIGTSKTAEYQLGKLIDIIRGIAKLIISAASDKDCDEVIKQKEGSDVKERVTTFITYRFNNNANTVLNCNVLCGKQPYNYGTVNECDAGCKLFEESIKAYGANHQTKYTCYDDKMIDNRDYNKKLKEALDNINKQQINSMNKYFKSSDKSTNNKSAKPASEFDKRIKIIDVFNNYYKLIRDNFDYFKPEVISYIDNNGSIPTNIKIPPSNSKPTNPPTYYPCKK